MILKDDIGALNGSANDDLNIKDLSRSYEHILDPSDRSISPNQHARPKKRKWLGKTKSLYFMMSLTLIVFLLELIIGNATNSNSLVADSFHMLRYNV
jgi:Co/Zn/Cd efflux system component